MSDQQLGKFSEGFANWRRLLASMPDDARRLTIFINAAVEVSGYIAKGLSRTIAADELADMAIAHGLNDTDEVQRIISEAFGQIEEPEQVPGDLPGNGGQQPGPNGKHRARIRFMSKADFVGGFMPPVYLIDDMLQRRFVYALTGQTGHAKTAIALLLAQLVSSAENAMFGRHRVEKGKVIYFVGENPDDIRMRVIGADSQRQGGNPLADRITFIPGVFNIVEMQASIATHADKLGGVDLVIIDTSAAYFLGNEELSNTQMGAHARMLRRLTELPGGPCVLVLCHPIKHVTEASQLLPRGGGAFLNEMDGNLTAWKHDDTLIELHHGKIRGPGFEPMTFKLETIRTPNLCDAKGRMLPTVRAVAISQSDEDQQTGKARKDEDRVLAVRLKAGDEMLSIAEIAARCEWTVGDGSPAKSRVHRTLERLEKAKPPLMYRDRSQWKLTEKGKDAARHAALRIAAEVDAKRNEQMGMDLR